MSLKQGIKDAIKSMPAESRNQMLEALSTLRGYQDTLPDGSPNPVGRLGFVARTIAEQMAAETAMYFQQKAFRELPPPPRIDIGPDETDAK